MGGGGRGSACRPSPAAAAPRAVRSGLLLPVPVRSGPVRAGGPAPDAEPERGPLRLSDPHRWAGPGYRCTALGLAVRDRDDGGRRAAGTGLRLRVVPAGKDTATTRPDPGLQRRQVFSGCSCPAYPFCVRRRRTPGGGLLPPAPGPGRAGRAVPCLAPARASAACACMRVLHPSIQLSVCLSVCLSLPLPSPSLTHARTHTHKNRERAEGGWQNWKGGAPSPLPLDLLSLPLSPSPSLSPSLSLSLSLSIYIYIYDTHTHTHTHARTPTHNHSTPTHTLGLRIRPRSLALSLYIYVTHTHTHMTHTHKCGRILRPSVDPPSEPRGYLQT